mmetsp:Transcript_2962/g.6498  ORF Transcript_2962/g.6498 Transcript_2962/m.6498 type:complete len:207 (-) Transcript_2962:27-647(-)
MSRLHLHNLLLMQRFQFDESLLVELLGMEPLSIFGVFPNQSLILLRVEGLELPLLLEQVLLVISRRHRGGERRGLLDGRCGIAAYRLDERPRQESPRRSVRVLLVMIAIYGIFLGFVRVDYFDDLSHEHFARFENVAAVDDDAAEGGRSADTAAAAVAVSEERGVIFDAFGMRIVIGVLVVPSHDVHVVIRIDRRSCMVSISTNLF